VKSISREKERLALRCLVEDEEFAAKVRRLMGPRRDGCMPWRGTVDNRGYGRVKLPKRVVQVNIPVRATRLVLILTTGELPPEGAVVAHTCDNPVCVNPDHLLYRSQGWNLKDAWNKGKRTHWGGKPFKA